MVIIKRNKYCFLLINQLFLKNISTPSPLLKMFTCVDDNNK